MDASFAIITSLSILLITEPDGRKVYTGPWAEFACEENRTHTLEYGPAIDAECIPQYTRRAPATSPRPAQRKESLQP